MNFADIQMIFYNVSIRNQVQDRVFLYGNAPIALSIKKLCRGSAPMVLFFKKLCSGRAPIALFFQKDGHGRAPIVLSFKRKVMVVLPSCFFQKDVKT